MNNDLESAKQAEVLVNALPYIQKYNDKIIVVKYGGNAMLNEELKTAVMNDIVLLSLVGIKVVLVHGGGPEINDMLKRVGKESKFISGLRYTDDETAEIVQMVLAGKVNKDLVKLLSGVGGRAVGFCGIDGNIITAKKKEGDIDLGNVGEIVDVDVDPILVTLENDYIPVIATVASGEDGKIYNINADTAAAAIAGLAYLFADPLLQLLLAVLPVYRSYPGGRYWQGNSAVYLLAPLGCFFFSLPLIRQAVRNPSASPVLANSAFYSLLIQMFVTQHFILERLSIYTAFFSILALPEAVREVSGGRRAKVWAGLLAACCLAYFIFAAQQGFHGVYPYHGIWSRAASSGA